jgi:hypothetical protein
VHTKPFFDFHNLPGDLRSGAVLHLGKCCMDFPLVPLAGWTPCKHLYHPAKATMKISGKIIGADRMKDQVRA